MGQLSVAERRGLIADYVDEATINWAHIGIAQLMKHGFVDRILTTNFDLLAVRACALIGRFPAVYDFAASQLYKPADIPEQAVIYLHGQRTGFVIMNTEEECKRHADLLAPVFQDAGQGRVWLVVGYSGENDPVFDHMAAVQRFDNKLYWVGYKDAEPATHVREHLLVDGKYAFYVNGFDADSFFIKLAQKLGCFPPDFCKEPFSHLERCLDTVAPFPMPGQSSDIDVLKNAYTLVRAAKQKHEKPTPSDDKRPAQERISPAALTTLLMGGHYDEVVRLGSAATEDDKANLAEPMSWAYVMQGLALSEQAETKSGDDADRLFALAGKKYEAALNIKPDNHEALDNWGLALSEQAETKSGDDADRLFNLAGEKYKAALNVKSDKHEALYNWGTALLHQAKTKSGDDADRLFALAGKKYEAALNIKPDMHEALNNWGNALSDQAKTKSGDDADRLFSLAGEKYEAALNIKPDKHEGLNNWGIAISDQAKTKSGDDADRLFALAGKKYEAALNIKPDMHEALYNWGTALLEQARTKSDAEADQLFKLAGEKYEAAFKVKPDMHDALYNWGTALLDQARTKSGGERDRVLAKAEQKLLKANSISAGAGAYNLACVYTLQGKAAECEKWLQHSLEHGILPSREHLEEDTDLDSVRDKKWFKEFLAGLE